MRDKLFTCVVLLPLLGILAFMGQAQYRASTGEVYRVRIKGYDPRDLLRGHYLRYRFDFSTQLTSSASLTDYCFVREGENRFSLSTVSSSDQDSCTSRIKRHHLERAQKYFIPEAHADALERQLRDQFAEVDLIINANGHYSVGRLYLDGVPWEESVIK